MVGWHHQLNGHEFEQAPGDGEGQGSLVCCNPWGFKEMDMTEHLNNSRAPNSDRLLASILRQQGGSVDWRAGRELGSEHETMLSCR